MTSTTKPSPPTTKPALRGIRILPLISGTDGDIVEPEGRERRPPNRVVSIRLCPRSSTLSMTFQACGFTYIGKPGTEDPLEAARVGAAVRDAIEARLVAIGIREMQLAVAHLSEGLDVTPTRSADVSMMMTIVAAMVRAAPRAVAEATAVDGDRPSWSARPVPLAVKRSLL